MNSTPGEILRSTREEKKLNLQQVVQGTNIKLPFLEALENNQPELIPSKAQYRGFIRLYAGYLGLDPQDVLPAEAPNPQPNEEKAPEPIEPLLNPALHPVKPVRTIDTLSELASKIVEKIPAKEKKGELPPGMEAPPGTQTVHEAVPASTIILEDIGRSLEAQREALGLSRADVERQTRIREYYIYALEKGKLQELPSTVQGRGMLGNYAEFMNLDSDALQLRFAEALQQRRLELAAAENLNPVLAGPESKVVKKVPAWRKFVTPDMIVGGGMFILLFVFIIWGAMQVINTSRIQATEPPGSISEFLIQPTAAGTAITGSIPQITASPITTPGISTQTASTQIGNGPIQVVINARQRAYVRITADNEVVFDGRVAPGNVYSFSASKSILLLTGDASAIQVIFNQEDLGVLGSTGQVITLDFTQDGVITPTPRFTATPSSTPEPTITLRPTATSLPVTSTPYPTP